MSSLDIKKSLIKFPPFQIEVEDVGSYIEYADKESIQTIKDVGSNPNGKLLLKPISIGGLIDPVVILRDAASEGVNLGLYHAICMINDPLKILEELRKYKILFPGTLRSVLNRPFIPVIFFSKDPNARWRTSCVWMDEMIGPDYILLKYKITS